MKLRIIENVIQEASRKNIVDTLANKIKSVLIKYLIRTELNPDPKQEYTLPVNYLMDDLSSTSKKFKAPLEKIIIRNTPLWRGPEETAHYNYNTKHIMLYISYGYNQRQFDIYKEIVDGKKKADQAKFEVEVEKTFESNKTKKGYRANTKPEFTISPTVNKENLSQMKKAFPMYTSPKDVEEIINKCKPGSQTKKIFFYKEIGKLSDTFSTIVHEIAHAKQYQNAAGEPYTARMNQLNSYFLEENLPMMTLFHYTSTREYDFQPFSRATDLGKFFYYSRPIEIDARLKEARLFYRNKVKENRETAGNELFEYIKKKEERFVQTITVRSYFQTDELATEELRAKCLHQVYYQISKDAKDIFSKSPYFQVELDKWKSKVDEINNKINSNLKVSKTADERQKNKYRYYSSYNKKYIEEPKEEV